MCHDVLPDQRRCENVFDERRRRAALMAETETRRAVLRLDDDAEQVLTGGRGCGAEYSRRVTVHRTCPALRGPRRPAHPAVVCCGLSTMAGDVDIDTSDCGDRIGSPHFLDSPYYRAEAASIRGAFRPDG